MDVLNVATRARQEEVQVDLEPAKKLRVAWVDYAKGICIFLVVMLHTNHHVELYKGVDWNWLDNVVAFARPFRMPDFFLLAGLFVARIIKRPWRYFVDSKILHFYYFYVLWLVFIFLYFDVRFSFVHHGWDQSGHLLKQFLMELVEPSYPLWFIHSLPIYFLITRLVAGVPAWIILGITAILQMSSVHTGITVIDQFCLRFVYFYSGFLLASKVFDLAAFASRRPSLAICYLLGWGIIEETLVHYGVADKPGLSLALGYLGAFAVIMAATLFAKIRWMAWLRALGKNSLVIYLGFMIPMSISYSVLSGAISDAGWLAVCVTICAVGGAAFMYWLAGILQINFLYHRPAWARIVKPAGTSD